MNSPSLHRIGCKPWRRRFGTNGTVAAMENYRLPKAEKERLELAATIGTDGDQLLAAIDAAVEQPWLSQLPAIHVLREVCTAQYIKVSIREHIESLESVVIQSGRTDSQEPRCGRSITVVAMTEA